MKNNRKHLFHILDFSPWPLVAALGGFFLLSGLTFYMHRIYFGGYFVILGFVILLFTIFFWFKEIIEEAAYYGHHTIAVRAGIRFGFLLFIISEIMLFLGFFWAFFHSSLCPSILLGSQWPPQEFLLFLFYNSLYLTPFY